MRFKKAKYRLNECKCGNITVMEHYAGIKEDGTFREPKTDIFLAPCVCKKVIFYSITDMTFPAKK